MTQARDGDRQPISERDLHGYIDGELTAQRRAEVETYLTGHPAEAARIAEYAALTLSLHRLYAGGHAADPRIDALTADLDRTLRRRRMVHRLVRVAAVAAVLAIVAGVASSVHDRFLQAENRFLAFTRQATDAHILFAGAKPPAGDSEPGDDTTVVSWLSQRLIGVPVRAPDLHALGYELTVERILPSANGPAAQLMYESAKAAEPVTLFIGKSKDNRQIAFTYVRNDDLSVFYWQKGPLAYSLAGKLDRRNLLALAEVVNAQLVTLPPVPRSMVQRRAADVIHAAGKAPLDAGARSADARVRPLSKKLEASEIGVVPGRVNTEALQPVPVKDGAAVKRPPEPSAVPAPASESDTAKKT